MVKRILFLIAIIFLLTPGLSLAAGSCVLQSAEDQGAVLVANYLCTGDAAAGTVPDTHIDVSGTMSLSGTFYYEIETIPGTGDAEPTAYSVTLKNSRGTTIAAVTGRSATAAKTETIDTGPHVIDTPVTMAVSDLGNSDTATIILKFIK